MDITPIDQATSILGEHYKNYVVIIQDYDLPSSFDIHYSDPFATKGLLDLTVKHHDAYLEGGISDELDCEWVWEDEVEEDDDCF